MSESGSRLTQLRRDNETLKQRIAQFREHQNAGSLQAEITKFMQESQNNLQEMNRKITDEHA